ncbi:MAG: type II toxin-antitoxin system VapC family toxin [Acidimicrobiales bacterium]
MSLVYFDSSALVKLVVEEKGSDVASALWDGCDAALSSRLAHPEVCAALAAAHRNHDLDEDGFAAAARDWAEFWAALRPVELTRDVERRAGDLARRRVLRGADAVHLASALAIEAQDLVVAVWDRRLHDGATAEQLMVAPAALPR